MKQPVSTITNVAYAWAAYEVMLRASEPLHWIVGISLILLAVGSGLYHSTLTSIGQSADESAMYLVFAFLIGLAAEPYTGLTTAFYGSSLLATVLIGWHKPIDSSWVLPAMYVPIFTAMVLSSGWQTALLITGLMLGAALVREFGERFGGSGSHHIAHELSHGFWHLATAFGLYQITITLA